jgi:Glycosyltransferase family 87
MRSWLNFLQKTPVIISVYAAATIAFSLQRWSLGNLPNGYTAYENYVIFRNSFVHLFEQTNIYGAFPAEQWDLYKYSPAFALCMAPFRLLPDALGLTTWNLLNAFVFLAGLYRLPVLDARQRAFCAWFLLPELLGSIQNSQSNGLTAGLMLLAFAAFERGKTARAAAFIAGAAFIKVFGILAAVLCVLYPKPFKFSVQLALCCLFLALVPFAFLPPNYSAQLYIWWAELLRDDHAASIGLSVAGWLQSWFGWAPPKSAIALAGLVLLGASILAPILRSLASKSPSAIRPAPSPISGSRYAIPGPRTNLRYRILAWSALLIWVVVFNHKAESPTFIIALSGVSLWYAVSSKKIGSKVLLWACFALASLSPTDFFPRTLRQQIIQPYVLKAVPFIAAWGLITFILLRAYWRTDKYEK